MNHVHYLALIQAARHTAEETSELVHDLPAETARLYLERAKRKLEAGLELLKGLPQDPQRAGTIVAHAVARARRAIAELEREVA